MRVGEGFGQRAGLSRADNFSQLVMGKPTATVLRVSVDPYILWPLCPWTIFLRVSEFSSHPSNCTMKSLVH